MIDTVLSPQRRAELLSLLEDEERLGSEFPNLAEYLRTAPFLQGTCDDHFDGQFDLRLIHFMTAETSPSDNPYWDTVAAAVSMNRGRRVVDGGNPKGSPRLAFAQTVLQEVYAYAVPSPETLRWMCDVCDGRPVIEVGAGRGYWASRLMAEGLSVAAFDSDPPDPADSSIPVWFQVQNLDGLEAVRAATRHYVLLLCWPPGWGSDMAVEALANYESAGGRCVIYVGEPKGGKTANDQFFSALDRGWQLSSTDPQFTSWWNLNDRAQTWIR